MPRTANRFHQLLKFLPGRHLAIWLIWGIALIVILPVIIVAFRAIQPNAFWAQILENRLPGYLWETALLAFLVTALAILFGVPAAWFISVFKFPGRRIFEWLMMVPLAMPGFIAAIAYLDMLHHLTPVYIWVRQHHGIDAFLLTQKLAPWVFAVLVLASTLYPYVFLSCRAIFLKEASGALEASRMLGAGPLRTFLTIALPMARPAIVAGASLVAMEAINDYGVVSYFGLGTLTPGIFRAWTEGQLPSAMRLSLILIAFALLALGTERWQRGKKKFVTDMGDRPLSRRPLSLTHLPLAWLACGVPLLLGFFIPVWQLMKWAAQSWHTMKWKESLPAAWNTLWLSTITAVLIIACGAMIVAARRAFRHPSLRVTQKIGLLGYTFPSALVAVGIGAMVSWLANVHPTFSSLALSASTFGIMLAYFVRFLAVGIQPTVAGFERVPQNLHEAARTLGHGPLRALFQVDFPLVWTALLAGSMLAFIDIFKELTMTLVLRPFDFETLATRVFRLTDEARIPEASIPALSMVFFSLIGLIPLSRMMRRSEEKSTLLPGTSKTSSTPLHPVSHSEELVSHTP